MSELIRWKNSEFRECFVLKGARQVGKTYIIDEFIKSNCRSSLKIDFSIQSDMHGIFDENLDVDRIIADLMNTNPGFRPIPNETILFFDEIQLCPRARNSLKSFALDGRYRVIASDSLLGMSYNDKDSVLPMGYEMDVELRPLDFEEFLWALGIDKKGTSSIRQHISDRKGFGKSVLEKYTRYFNIYSVVGGMPKAVNTYLESNNLNDVRRVQQKIIAGYRGDISKYADRHIQDKIIAAYDSIPMHLSMDNKKFMFSRIESNFVPTYGTYIAGIKWMCDASIAELCRNLTQPKLPLAENVTEKEFKLYLRDTGLLVCMLGINVAHAIMAGDPRVNKGAVAENAVAQAISNCGLPLFYFRNDALEIDFIAEMRGKIAALEVKSGNNNKSQSLKSVASKYDVGRKMKFEIGDIKVDKNDVEHYPLFASAFADSMFEQYDVDLTL